MVKVDTRRQRKLNEKKVKIALPEEFAEAKAPDLEASMKGMDLDAGDKPQRATAVRRTGRKQPFNSHRAEHRLNPNRAGSGAFGEGLNEINRAKPSGAGPMTRSNQITGPSATAGNIPNTKADGIPEGLNYMEEQFVKYGNDLGNYKPQPIIGTDMYSSVYTNHETLTPAEYDMFFGWQHPQIPGGKSFARNKPSGHKGSFYDTTHLHANVLAEKDRKYEFTRQHGGVVQNRTRDNEAPVFLCSF